MTWLKNSRGKPDAMLTFSAATLAVVLGKVVFGGLDAGTIGALLTPTLGAYVGRRWMERESKKEP